MKYGIDFFVVGPDGQRIAHDGVLADKKYFPSLRPFRYQDVTGGWWLLEDFTIDVKIGKVWYRMTARAGFDYDGASIPRFCRSLVGDKMAHDVIVAALFHDLFYCVHHAIVSKAVADALLRDISGVYSATRAKQLAVYEAVHIFGGGPWHEDGETKMDKYAPMLSVVEIAA